ncbi:MAG: PKD domain-containing protein [Fibrobacter sp.]|nr:PKD domain-containing protein [Fibrobacter sp.]
MISLLKLFTLLVLTSSFFCAQRDNRFDPMSPLFQQYNPQLNVALITDSTRTISITPNAETLSVYVPLKVTLNTTSKGGETGTEELPVFVTHFLNNEQVGLPLSNSSQEILLTDTGTHLFRIETSNRPGDTVITKNIVIFARPTPNPRLTSCTSSASRFPIRHEISFLLSIKIYDRFKIAEKIAYEFSSYRTVYHQVSASSSDTIFDSLFYSINKNSEDTESVTIKVTDLFGRIDSSKITLVFSKDIPFVKGLPPEINVISADPDTAMTNENVEFFVKASDSDGKIVDYEWFFSDTVTGRGTNFVRSFKNPGTYTARVKVTDDSGSTDIDSVRVTIVSSDNTSPVITSFTATPDSGTIPFRVDFAVSVIDKDNFTFTYYWFFPDSFAKTYEPKISYTFKGCPCIYMPVMVIVKDLQKNADTAFTYLKFTQKPKPELCISPDTIFTGQYFSVTYLPGSNRSIDTTTTHFSWIFLDRTFHSNLPFWSPPPLFRPGNYSITLIVHGSKNDTISKKFTVFEQMPPHPPK